MTNTRKLPPPMRHALHGGEKVKVKARQEYYDGFIAEVGDEGLAMHPGSQAATWVVLFPKARTRRVVPEWDLEVISGGKGH